ncbi:MAG: flavodoxin domain-containing protein [Thermoplasmata archaeon]|nr:flavodoxin domain-containing protein [Thermoplasmata archaeon]MCI4361774.1 flavodoxin domain-containing protein [Thermoplasmata archaeon]
MSDTSPDLLWADDQPLRTAVILYDTHYGKTRQVAEHLAVGLRKEGVKTDLLPVARAHERPLDTYDMLVFGCPTEHIRPSRAMAHLLHELKHVPTLKGHYGFAFDTRLRHHLSGAGNAIDSAMYHLGLRTPVLHASAIVESPGEAGVAPRSEPMDSGTFRLEPGTEQRFEELGVHLVREIRGETHP